MMGDVAASQQELSPRPATIKRRLPTPRTRDVFTQREEIVRRHSVFKRGRLLKMSLHSEHAAWRDRVSKNEQEKRSNKRKAERQKFPHMMVPHSVRLVKSQRIFFFFPISNNPGSLILRPFGGHICSVRCKF